MNHAESSLLARTDSLRDTLTRWLKELVAIPTVNPYSGDASAASEAPGQEWIERQFRGLGGVVRRVPVPEDIYARCGLQGAPGRSWKGRENVVAEWRLGSGQGPTVILNSHMDTVGVAGMEFDPFAPVVTDGRMRGRGTSDSKGNLVMGLVALKALLESGGSLNGRIVFESVVDEECSGGGAGTLACCLAGITGDLAIVMDGQHGQIVTGCNGVLTARLTVRGRSGHSADPQSVNAIDKAMTVKAAFDAFSRDYLRRYPRCHAVISMFRAGTLPAVVPGEAEMMVHMSYDCAAARAAEEADGRWGGGLVRREVDAAMAGLPAVDAWFAGEPVAVTWVNDLHPFATDTENPYVRLAAATAEEVSGPGLKMGPMRAWFDAAWLSRKLRLPVIGLGHGTAGTAHSAGEYVILDDLRKGAGTVALTLHRMLSSSNPQELETQGGKP